MKKNLLQWTAVAGITATLGLTSCTYDPGYSAFSGSYSSGYGSGYDSGYGYGHGYGGSGFSTSVFVSTGDPRWGYDPYSYSYYDYHSRRYYDPYLYGYYPIGYRPPVLIGVPHPHGWRPGRSYCPPPRTVRNHMVVNYRDRASAYRNTDHSWARNVRMKDYSRGDSRAHTQDHRRGSYDADRRGRDSGPTQNWNRNSSNPGYRSDDTRRSRQSPSLSPDRTASREARAPSSYQAPVTRRESSQSHNFTDPRQSRGFDRSNARSQPSPAASRRDVREAPPAQFRRPEAMSPQRNSGFRGGSVQPQRQPQSRPQPQQRSEPPARGNDRRNDRESRRGLRSLGDA